MLIGRVATVWRSGERHGPETALLWWLAAYFLGIGANLSLDWPRYYVPTAFYGVILIGLGVQAIAALAAALARPGRTVSRRRPSGRAPRRPVDVVSPFGSEHLADGAWPPYAQPQAGLPSMMAVLALVVRAALACAIVAFFVQQSFYDHAADFKTFYSAGYAVRHPEIPLYDLVALEENPFGEVFKLAPPAAVYLVPFSFGTIQQARLAWRLVLVAAFVAAYAIVARTRGAPAAGLGAGWRGWPRGASSGRSRSRSARASGTRSSCC